MTEEITQHEGISRRTIVKGAAWSIPVMAAAVAAPAAVATGGPAWDVTVSGTCANEYDISALEALVPLPATLALVQAALAAIGIDDDAARSFTITATEGTVPAGTTFSLAYPDGLIDLTALEGIIEAEALTVATINNTQTTFTLDSDLTEGDSITIDLFDSIIEIGALSSITLSLVGSDNPTDPGSEGADSATVSTLVGAAVNLGSLGIPLVSGTLEVQLCG